ncbi:hypothetical protein [Natronospora cellulosivora (SeqCode)]
MRKENSELLTAFVSDAGDFKENRDYFAFVELDDYACWVLASGLDSASDKLSSEIVVASILNDFTEKPSMSKRAIRKYIRNANKNLINESNIIRLQATVLVVVSDYTSIRWANVGNTRLYHLRKDKIVFKSKDHSIAQLMLDTGEINERQLNQHPERNNLSKYLGKKKKIRPYISKKSKLQDTDVLTICSSGYWENIIDQDIEKILKDITEEDEFVRSLEETFLSELDKELSNYTIASIMIKKAFKESTKKKEFHKKIAMILIPLLMLTAGYATYRRVKTINARRAVMMVRRQQFTFSRDTEERGDYLYEEGRYEEALAEFQKSKENFIDLEEDDEVRSLQNKIRIVRFILDGKQYEERAKNYLATEEYHMALENFEKAREYYLRSNDYDTSDIESDIEKTSRITQAIELEGEGDVFFDSGSYSMAIDKYNSAQSIYRAYGLIDRDNQIVRKKQDTQNSMSSTQQLEQANRLVAAGDEYTRTGQYNNAILSYIEARVIFNNLNRTDKSSEMQSKIQNAENLQGEKERQARLANAEELERDGDFYYSVANTSEARSSYSEARTVFLSLGLTERVNRMDEKIQMVSELESSKVIDKELSEARELEQRAEELLREKEYTDAADIFRDARAIYRQLSMSDEIERMTNRIIETNNSRHRDQINRFINLANSNLNENNFDDALFNYRQAENISIENNFDDTTQEIRDLINTARNTMFKSQGSQYEKEADDLFEKGSYNEAIELYNQARRIYVNNSIREELEKIDEKINRAIYQMDFNEAKRYEREGDILLEEENFDEAIEQYNKAKEFYIENNVEEEIQNMNRRINRVIYQKNYNQAKAYEREGDILLEEEAFNEAIDYYNKAREIYSDNEITEDVSQIDRKINVTLSRQKYAQARSYEKQAEVDYEAGNYEDSILNLEKASGIYNELEAEEDVQRINERMEQIDREQRGILRRVLGVF